MRVRPTLFVATMMAASAAAATATDVVIAGAGWSLPATLVLPSDAGPRPCVVVFAGSGPTDRDWLSPLIPGKNGSGRQLADALAARGIGSLRFDKVGSGANMKDLAVLSLSHYADEGEAAFDFLAKRPECTRVYLLGHSEGSMHAFATAARKSSDPKLGGVVSLAGPSRTMLDLAIEQIRRAHAKKGDDATAIDRALAGFRTAITTPGAPAPDFSRIPEAAPLWTVANDPRQAKVARELLLADPLAVVKTYHGRTLVVAGGHDDQVPTSDADRIVAALPTGDDAKRKLVVPEANHVFKREPRDPATLPAAEIARSYADADRPLADGLVDAIVAFTTP